MAEGAATYVRDEHGNEVTLAIFLPDNFTPEVKQAAWMVANQINQDVLSGRIMTVAELRETRLPRGCRLEVIRVHSSNAHDCWCQKERVF